LAGGVGNAWATIPAQEFTQVGLLIEVQCIVMGRLCFMFYYDWWIWKHPMATPIAMVRSHPYFQTFSSWYWVQRIHTRLVLVLDIFKNFHSKPGITTGTRLLWPQVRIRLVSAQVIPA
jgi:hypothetical protein